MAHLDITEVEEGHKSVWIYAYPTYREVSVSYPHKTYATTQPTIPHPTIIAVSEGLSGSS